MSVKSSNSQDKFSKDFAKAIAKALQEKEQQQQQQQQHFEVSNPSLNNASIRNNNTVNEEYKWQAAHDAYRALCFDDPRVESDEACRWLAQELLAQRSNDTNMAGRVSQQHFKQSHASQIQSSRLPLALSERMVEGLRQATNRFQLPPPNSLSTTTSKTEISNTSEAATHSLLPTTQTSASAVGYATLASVVFAEIPLQCLLLYGSEHDTNAINAKQENSWLTQVQYILGSYRGPQYVEATVEQQLMTLNINNKADEQPKGHDFVKKPPCSEDSSQETLEYQVKDDNTDECHEIWAQESDPSDFVYESNGNCNEDWSAWDSMGEIHPVELSKPILDDDSPAIVRAISNLLHDLTHDKFVPLHDTLWNQRGMSETLTQLTLLLLVGNHGNNQITTPAAAAASRQLQKMSVQPLNVFRDRVLLVDHHGTNNQILQDFLCLVQSLIAVDTAQQQPPINSIQCATSSPVAYASMLGLITLASTCAQASHTLREKISVIRKCVLTCGEDLCSLVERSLSALLSWSKGPQQQPILSSNGDSDSQQSPLQWTINMTWAFLPLLELLANINTDGSTLCTRRIQGAYLPVNDAQWLLNCGLFRALIMLFVKTDPFSSQSTALEPARYQLLQCLQMLALQNMSLLGKYAWRVPELNVLIHEDAYKKKNVVDGFVWFLMGQQLAGDATVLRLRTTEGRTFNKCKEFALDQWHLLCSKVLDAIQEIGASRLRRQHGKNRNSSAEDYPWKQSIVEMTRLANCLVSCDALPPLWRQAMDNDQVREQLKNLQQEISNLPSPLPPTCRSNPKASTKTAENDKAGDPLERPDPFFEVDVDKVRKSIKVLTMCLDPHGEEFSTRGLASKTD